MKWPQRWGVLDEAGDVGSAEGSSRYLVVAVVLTGDLQPLRRIVARARKRLGKRLKDIPELKAKITPARLVERLLEDVVLEPVEIVAVILDKRHVQFPDAPEEQYRRAFAQAVRICLERYPYLSLIADKRYTQRYLEDRLAEVVMENLRGLSGQVVWRYEASESEKALQVADAVAWAVFQKYERGNDRFYRIVRERIIVEKVIKKKDWLTLGADSHRSEAE